MPSPIFSFFFKPLEILVSQDCSYFSHNPCQIIDPPPYTWKVFRLEDINKNVSGYGNQNWAEAYAVIWYRQLQYTVNCFVVHQNGLDVPLRFEIYPFGVMLLKMKQKTKFWKIGPCTFKLISIRLVKNYLSL